MNAPCMICDHPTDYNMDGWCTYCQGAWSHLNAWSDRAALRGVGLTIRLDHSQLGHCGTVYARIPVEET